MCVGASVRAHPENIALNGTVTSHPSPLHNDPPWKDKHPWDWSERNAPDGNTPNRLQWTYYRLFVWADGIWGTNMKTYANYRHNAPYSWTFSGKRTPRTEGGNLWEKHGFVGWQCSLSSHVSCADGPAQKDREDTRFGRITWAQNKWATIKAMSKYICECLATSMAVSENAGPKLVGSQIS